MSFFDTVGDLLGLNKGKATSAAANKNKGLINDLAGTGRDIIGGVQDTTGDYLDLGKLGATAYANALGLNGTDGTASARDMYETSPGYEFGLDQGLQALQRTASAQGRLQSGNTDLDLLKYATGYAQQDYGDWLNRLGGYNDMYGAGVDRDNAAAGLGLDFESGISSGLMGANNQYASGKEAGQGSLLDLASTIAGIGGKAFGYGGFGGTPAASVNPRTGLPPIY